MPATEQTRYSVKRLHRIFAVSSVALLLATVWMFVEDHRRQWKRFQRTANKIEARTTVWKKYQFETGEAVGQRQRLQEQLEAARRQAIDMASVDQFRSEVAAEGARLTIAVDFDNFDRRRDRLEAAQRTLPAQVGPSDDVAEEIRTSRAALFQEMQALVDQAAFRETRQFDLRTSITADLDVAKANVGVAIRNGRPLDEINKLQSSVDELNRRLLVVSAEYEARWEHRESLEEILKELSAEERELQKSLAANRAELERLESALVERRSTWVHFDYGFPLPGKRVLELPILDAFNSPLRIHNLWAEGLTQDYHFREVLRFDRCTTCHTAIQNNAGTSAATPEFPCERVLQFVLQIPEAAGDTSSETDSPASLDETHFEAVFGLRFAEEGLLRSEDVTIMYVRPQSPATGAKLATEPRPQQSDEEIYRSLLWPADTPVTSVRPGLLMGDVLVAVNGEPVAGRWSAMTRLFRAAKGTDSDDDGSIVLTVRRGLPNPYLSHARLDLFVGELSPHNMSSFACTICHGGQGSATDFTWASHSPDDESERRRWREEYHWFDNPHWDDPMFPRRLAESSCLKCHHRVVDLLPSERFPEPPAPKLMRGYRLIQAFGCYGCHEIVGMEEGRSIGPDLRLEPHGIAGGLTSSDSATTPAKPGVDQRPGTLRRPGPSLRHIHDKVDAPFLTDWLADPRRFQPATRMPRSFGLWDHLDGDSLKTAQAYEPVEISGIVAYLQAHSEDVSPLAPPTDIDEAEAAEQLARGRQLFQTRGCLACHDHKELSDAAQLRNADDIVSGPDLSAVADKLGGERGRKWLYTFLKEPTRYLPRTVMPNLYLSPETQEDETGDGTMTVDPAADIVEFLLASSSSGYTPGTVPDLPDDALNRLFREHLSDVFHGGRCDDYLERGIPSRLSGTLRVAERELLVPDEKFDDPDHRLPAEKKLRYVGFKSIAKYGCFGCHDIPGFETAKPIGTALADWGRIDPSRLAFENIAVYLDERPPQAISDTAAEQAMTGVGKVDGEEDSRSAYYLRQIRSGSRIGFGYQKLREPRSYDFRVADNKRYHDRLKMPQFPLAPDDREAVLTFVLGLVAQPPTDKYVYQPDDRREAIIRGQAVLEKYHCGSCHILQSEQWRLDFPPGTFGPQRGKPTYPFVSRPLSAEQLEQSQQIDRRGLLQATVSGMPALGVDGRPLVFDDYGDELFDDEMYDSRTLEYALQLWESAAIEGHGYQVGQSALSVWGDQIEGKRASDGGFLARYLLPDVVQIERKANPNAVGSQAWAWLPPPLVGEGRKVQSEWLYGYLLDPYPIRPASFMRMPKFTLSSDEARALVDYFAARDGVDYPYEFVDRRSPTYLQQVEQAYQQRLAQLGGDQPAAGLSHFADAMRIITDKNFCITCHIVGDFDPVTSKRAKGPDLADVYRRLRPDYLRRWVAQPTSLLPYTSMQVVIPYDENQENLGGVDQTLYCGTSIQQLDAVVDVLSNLDVYARGRGTLVPPKQPTDDSADAESVSSESD